MDLSNIFLYIAIGCVIISILWLIYISIDVKKDREERRKKERDEKTKVKVENLDDEPSNFAQVNVTKGKQRMAVAMSKTGYVTSEQILAATVVPKVKVHSRSPKVRYVYFKSHNEKGKYKSNLERMRKRRKMKKEELA